MNITMISYSKHGSWYEWYSTYLLGCSTPYRYELLTDLEKRDQLINIFHFEIKKTASSISLTEK